jgi:hypothetical protein
MRPEFTLYLLNPGEPVPDPHHASSEVQCASVKTLGAVVIVGANGTGKTRLGSWIDLQSPQHVKAHRISAQKSLAMPDSSQTTSVLLAEADLLYGATTGTSDNARGFKLGHKWGSRAAIHPLSDFNKLMTYLFSEQAEVSARYLIDSRATTKRVDPPVTKLEQVRSIWEALLPHRELVIGGGQTETKIKGSSDAPYKSSDMSDGERVIFYLVGQCLSAPKDGIIVVDEPELHLHKSLQAPLWAAVEALRPDCLFVYITHDVDFAAAQVSATKVWLKSFNGTSWDWEVINEVDGLPEDLLLEVLGSRKPVLFVEGENGSLDVALYRALLPNFLVMPRRSCTNVIDGVRTLRRNAKFHHLDVQGLIDRDRRGVAEIAALLNDHIFVLHVAEVENLFCTPELLRMCSSQLARNADTDLADVVQFAFQRLGAELDTQVSMHTAAEIKFRLNLFDEQAKGEQGLGSALTNLVNGIDVGALYQERLALFNGLIGSSDYAGLLKYYNRKSLAAQIGGRIGLANKELPHLILRLASGASVGAVRNAVRPYFGAFAHNIP